jgi:hypothetical protein
MHFPNLLNVGAACLLFASMACADRHVEDTTSETPAKTSGTLRLDGSAAELRHVYAFRTPYVDGEWKTQSKASIQVVLANEPVPEALLPQIEQALREGQRPSRYFSGLEDVLKGTSLQLLVLSVSKKEKDPDGLIRYDPIVCMNTFTARAEESQRFGVFSVREGVVRGRASHTWKDSVFDVGSASMEDREVACSFDVDFEVTIGGTPLDVTDTRLKIPASGAVFIGLVLATKGGAAGAIFVTVEGSAIKARSAEFEKGATGWTEFRIVEEEAKTFHVVDLSEPMRGKP